MCPWFIGEVRRGSTFVGARSAGLARGRREAGGSHNAGLHQALRELLARWSFSVLCCLGPGSLSWVGALPVNGLWSITGYTHGERPGLTWVRLGQHTTVSTTLLTVGMWELQREVHRKAQSSCSDYKQVSQYHFTLVLPIPYYNPYPFPLL